MTIEPHRVALHGFTEPEVWEAFGDQVGDAARALLEHLGADPDDHTTKVVMTILMASFAEGLRFGLTRIWDQLLLAGVLTWDSTLPVDITADWRAVLAEDDEDSP